MSLHNTANALHGRFKDDPKRYPGSQTRAGGEHQAFSTDQSTSFENDADSRQDPCMQGPVDLGCTVSPVYLGSCIKANSEPKVLPDRSMTPAHMVVSAHFHANNSENEDHLDSTWTRHEDESASYSCSKEYASFTI